MLCPKCNEKMIEGYIPSNKVLAFRANDGMNLPESKTYSAMGVRYVKLSRTPVFKAVKAESYYCPNCDFVIIPTIDRK